MAILLSVLLVLTSTLLILVVLVQRGRGGGLAGALGGMGGQSAFGTKAGDLFTRITIGLAAFWIVLCVVSIKMMSAEDDKFADDLGASAPADPQLDNPLRNLGGSEEPGAGGAAAGGQQESGITSGKPAGATTP